MGGDKDSLIGEAQAAHVSKAKGLHSPHAMGSQVFTHPQEKKGSITHKNEIMPSPQMSPSPLFVSIFIC